MSIVGRNRRVGGENSCRTVAEQQTANEVSSATKKVVTPTKQMKIGLREQVWVNNKPPPDFNHGAEDHQSNLRLGAGW
jgi:hypothetical protein